MKKKLTKEDYDKYMIVVNDSIKETEQRLLTLQKNKIVSKLSFEDWVKFQHGYLEVFESITVEELKNNNSKRVSILTYRGEEDPVKKLDDKIKEYTKGEKYWEFIDTNMDNPRTRIIVFGDL